MAELALMAAQSLAASLVTIGHPYSQAAINATAMDLIRWCKGEVIDGHVWLPEEQAKAIVEEARTTWDDGWPEKGGTLRLLALFREKFDRAKLGPERAVFDSKKLEAQYGPPEPAFAANLLKVATKAEYANHRRAMLWQAIRDSLYYTEGPGARGLDQFWQAAADKHKRNHGPEVAAFRAELERHGWQELMAFDWTKTEGAGNATA